MMDKERLQKYIGTENLTVIEAMRKIDLNGKGILYIVDSYGRLSGSLTDGDIRRWLIKTGDLSETVEQMAFRNTKSLPITEIQNNVSFMKKEKIQSVPIIDEEHRIVDIRFNYEEAGECGEEKGVLDSIPVIIMAGGRGTRLYPYTKILPKPLIPIGDVPILERIMERFYRYGVKDFYLTVNYKKEMIKSYFADQKTPYFIHYAEEVEPLGTAGSIRLITDVFSTPVIVTNCDILIEENFGKVMEHHRKFGNDMTIISSLKNMIIPYGVLHTKERGIITSMDEKPQLSYFINTGVYVVNPEFFDWIPEGKVFHMTDLAEKMMCEGKCVGMYPISENSFLDMGEFEEMKKMEDRINSGYVK